MKRIQFKAKVQRKLDSFKTNKAKLQWILDDMLSYFTNETRCLLGGDCQYEGTETSEGCAIGRLLTDGSAKYLDGKGDIDDIMWVYNNISPRKFGLPSFIVENHLFFRLIQQLHDDSNNWVENKGLSEVGLHRLSIIKSNFKLK